MFTRFVIGFHSPLARAEAGFFHAAYAVRDNGTQPAWLRQEVARQLTWYNRHLPVPGRLCREFRRRGTIWGICWFRPEAKEAIARAHYTAWLMEEGGEPVRRLMTEAPGELLWRDAMQVVTKPPKMMPRAFA
ncbi:MAG: hypothetical protein AAFR44_05105 [Pseudomonadota bacterium]